jgi:hypothetical protein
LLAVLRGKPTDLFDDQSRVDGEYASSHRGGHVQTRSAPIGKCKFASGKRCGLARQWNDETVRVSVRRVNNYGWPDLGRCQIGEWIVNQDDVKS